MTDTEYLAKMDELAVQFPMADLMEPSIRRKVEDGTWTKENNPLKHAPHTAAVVTATAWDRPYTREEAAFPAPWLRAWKYWPTVGRVDNPYGDRNLVCTCDSVKSYA